MPCLINRLSLAALDAAATCQLQTGSCRLQTGTSDLELEAARSSSRLPAANLSLELPAASPDWQLRATPAAASSKLAAGLGQLQESRALKRPDTAKWKETAEPEVAEVAGCGRKRRKRPAVAGSGRKAKHEKIKRNKNI